MRRLRLLAALVALALLAPALTLSTLAAPIASGARTLARAQGATCPTADYPTEAIQVMAPAGPGGGWDTTAREMQTALQAGVVDESVEVFNVEGSGGTIGLAQLVNDEGGNEHLLMMMGLVMVGAIATNQSEVTLDEVTPIARLTTEFEVVVVPADSEFQTLEDVINAFREDPEGLVWGGGSSGGTDHILVGLIAQAIGVDPTRINYVGYSGGGEARTAILSGDIMAGVSGIGEWRAAIESGELRALAVSGSAAAATDGTPTAGAATGTPTPDVAPTLREQGIDVELANWRGVVAPPDISDEARQCLIAVVEQMRAGDAWQEALTRNGWQDFYLPGDEFGAFLTAERDRVIPTLQQLGLVEA